MNLLSRWLGMSACLPCSMLRVGTVFPCRGKHQPCLGFWTALGRRNRCGRRHQSARVMLCERPLERAPDALERHPCRSVQRQGRRFAAHDRRCPPRSGGQPRQTVRAPPPRRLGRRGSPDAVSVPLGRAACLQMHVECPWRTVLVAATLHHLDVLTDDEKALVVRRAFTEVLAQCGLHDLPPEDVPIKSGSPGSRLLDGYLG